MRRFPVLLAVAATAAAMLSLPANAATGSVTFTDAYVPQARYSPGVQVTVDADLHETTGSGSWSGPVSFTVTHLGTTVATGSVNATVAAGGSTPVSWNVTPPNTDFTGYLVTITAGSASTATAIDVSSTWTHFPRFGTLVNFPTSATQASTQSDVDTLIREYHINALQFYDWMWRHENPVENNPDGSLPATWTGWNGNVISTSAIQDYVNATHNDGAAAMPYSMTYAGLQNYQQVSGVSPSWGLYNPGTTNQWSFAMTPTASLYFFNPANTSWQNYLAGQEVKTDNTFGFDGVHLDQLGNWGAKNDVNGNAVDIPDGFVSELNAIKGQLPAGKAIGFNTVDGYGGDQVASAANTSYLYSELWNNHETYQAAKSYFDTQHTESGGLPMVVAGYMNYYNDYGPDYEAENATLGGNASVNNNHTGYTGTGFIDNFGTTGDSVTFTVNVANPGVQSLVFRYSAAVSATATRTVTVDGSTVGDVQFVPTSDWNTWSTADVETPSLSAGTHTVKISLAGSDTGFINLDSLVLGQFDPASVELADSTFAAMGTTHIEMSQGDNMLAAPDFPDFSKQMTPALRAWMKNYYNFVTGYENLLYGPDVHSVDSGSQFVQIAGQPTSGDASANTIYTDVKKTGSDDVLHLINLEGNDNTWRDAGKATPPTLSNLAVKYYLGPNENPTAVHVASPDSANGASTNLAYTVGSDSSGRYVSFTVPQLQNWDMVYVDRTFSTPSGNQYEAENAVLTNVGTASDHAGYTGTGFVDNFDLANSGVSFTVNAPTAGSYNLVLRYGNGGSTASRIIAVDGNQVATPTFNALGTWDAWSTVTVPVTLSAGLHTVVVWDSDGTSGAINLDNLTLGS
ncbi:MAG TPA: glycoside hydrolase family 66 protein [Pseudonocardiaceae bacterium]|nr:glycoside hydrolase family 66 protein [Pseudonocardiaceae bacterium]